MRRWFLVLGVVGFPLLAAAAAPTLPKRFASQRFAPVTTAAALPSVVRRAVDRFIQFRPLGDFGTRPGRGHVISDHRALALAGLGRGFDFVLYEHSGGLSSTHDHLLVFEHGADRTRNLVLSCTGALPRKVDEVKAAVLRGECMQADAGVVERY